MKLEDVSCYKYLGLLFHVSGKYYAKQDLSDRSHKAIFKLMSCFKDGKPSFITGFPLFDRIVKPVLSYGADIIGYRSTKCHSLYNEMYSDIFEKCHLKFSRYILGVNKHAPILGIYGETGRFLYV